MSQVKKHLSASSIGLYSRCGEAWRRRYIENDVVPPTAGLARGKAFHHAAAINMSQKVESGKDMTVNDVQDAATENAKLELDNSDIESSEIDLVVDRVALMTAGHMTLQAPTVMPIEVEKEFRVETNLSRDFIGFIDVVGVCHVEQKAGDTVTPTVSSPMVIDWKTSQKSPNKFDALESIQLTGYAATEMQERGLTEIGVRLDHLILTPKGKVPKRRILDSKRDGADVKALAHRLVQINKAIDAEVFPPAAVGSWQCGPKWCGYWRSCKYVNAARREAAEKIEQLDDVLSKL
tara:strand:- start:5988 stop:6863 length:876 start_codon:yes stop_codon:yes gene_type:complete